MFFCLNVLMKKIKPKILVALAMAFLLLLTSSGIFYPKKEARAQDYEWRQVNDDGFGNANNHNVLAMVLFNGYLYVGIQNVIGGPAIGAQIWRTQNGTTWQQVVSNGFGDINNRGISSLVSFNGFLYAGTVNQVSGTEVWRCSQASGCNEDGDWAQVNLDGFGIGGQNRSVKMKVYNSYLYAGTDRIAGAQIWRTDGTGAPPLTWTQVNNDGFGVGINRINDFEIFNNDLYVGTRPAEIWKCTLVSGCDAPADWDWVVGQGPPPRGGGRGFGDASNWEITTLITFGSYLYAGTLHQIAAEVWRSLDGTTWTEVVGDGAGGGNGFGDINNDEISSGSVQGNYLYLATVNIVTGTEIYRSANGTAWTQVNADGFGDTNNRASRAAAIFGNHLFVGTSNLTTGAEMWQLNYKPEVSGVSAFQRTDGTGKVTITFSANDLEGDNLRGRVEYNIGAGWKKATLSTINSETSASSGDPKVNNGSYYQLGTSAGYIVTLSGVNDVTTTWNSKIDEPSADVTNARIRIKVFDGISESGWATSLPFDLDNVPPNPPTLNPVTSPTNVTPQRISGGKDANSSVLLNGTLIVALNASTTWSHNLNLLEGTNSFSLTSKDDKGNESGPTSGSIILDTTPPETEATPPGGTYPGSVAITLTSDEPATIYYTTDGSDPTTSSSVYAGPITISRNTTLKFFGVDALGNQETIKTEIYVITPTWLTMSKSVSIESGGAAAAPIFKFNIKDLLLPKPFKAFENLKALGSFLWHFIKYPNHKIYPKIALWLLVLLLGFAGFIVILIISEKIKGRKIFQSFEFAFYKYRQLFVGFTLGITVFSLTEVFLAFRAISAADTYVKRGDTLVYRIDYRNISTETALDFYFVDSIPSYTDYIRSTMILNGALKTDARDADEADFNATWPGHVYFRIGAVAPGTSGTAQFKVKVKDTAPNGALIPDKAIGAYNPGNVRVESNPVLNIVRVEVPVTPVTRVRRYYPPTHYYPPEKVEEVPPEIPVEKPPIEKPPTEKPPIKKPPIEKPPVRKPEVLPVEKKIPEIVAEKVYKNKILQNINKWAAAPFLALVALVNLLSVVSLFDTLIPFLRYLWQIFTEPLLYFGKRARKGWGVVYNSLTKQPIDLAIVRLFDQETEKLVETRVTDFEGRYLFIVDIGKKYYLVVTKPGFIFPSKILAKAKVDGDYNRIYHGEVISTGRGIDVKRKEQGYIAFNIPLDPEEGVFYHPEIPRRPIKTEIKNIADLEKLSDKDLTRENEKVLNAEKALKIHTIIGYVGPVLGLLSFIVTPSILTFVLLVLHIILLALFLKLARRKEVRPWGKVFDIEEKTPLPKAVVRLFDTRYGKLLSAMVSKSEGRYGFLVGREKYYLASARAGFIFPAKKVEVMGVKEGVIRKDLGMKKAR